MVDHVFSILPFGLQPHFDIDGWESEVADTALSEMIIVEDLQLKSEVIELTCDTFYKVAMSFPDESKMIGTPFPYCTLHLKNLNKFVAFEIEVEDSNGLKRTIRSSSAQSLARCKENLATMPMRLVPGWNCITLDLQALCQRLFGTNLRHTIRVRVFANCRLRRIYFHDQIMQEHELPSAVRVFADISAPITDLLHSTTSSEVAV